MKFYPRVSLILALAVFSHNVALAHNTLETENATTEAALEDLKQNVYHIALTTSEADESGLSREVQEAIKEMKARKSKVDTYLNVSLLASLVVGASGGIFFLIMDPDLDRRIPGIAEVVAIYGFVFSLITSAVAIELLNPKPQSYDKVKNLVPLIQSHLDTTCETLNGSTGKSVQGMMIQSMIFPPEAFANGLVRLNGRAISQTEYENLNEDSKSPSYVFVSTKAKCKTGIFSSATLAELSH